MSRIAVNEELLRWAIQRSGKSLAHLQRNFPNVRAWRAGSKLPTLRQLESFAKATSTPLGYFFLEKPPTEELPIPHFRTIRDEPSRRPSAELLDTIQSMQRRQAWMREILIEDGQSPLSIVGSVKPGTSPGTVAALIRLFLGLHENWAERQRTWTEALQSLRAAIDLAGILVVSNGVVGNNTHRSLDPEEFRGFVLVDEYAPLVFVNGADAKAAQMFTLAHELAHIWFGSSAAFDLRGLQPANHPTERSCNQVAAELLVPEVALRDLWSQVRREADPFQAIARKFKVSALVAARRALDLRLIRKARFFDFYGEYLENLRQREQMKPSGGDFYATQAVRVGRRFGQTVVQAVKEGRLLYQEAFQLTGLHGKTFAQFSDRIEYEANT